MGGEQKIQLRINFVLLQIMGYLVSLSGKRYKLHHVEFLTLTLLCHLSSYKISLFGVIFAQ